MHLTILSFLAGKRFIFIVRLSQILLLLIKNLLVILLLYHDVDFTSVGKTQL